MKFRDHPLLSYRWPPTWLWGGGGKYVPATGEVGMLKDVMLWSTEPYEKCLLIMEHEGRKYIRYSPGWRSLVLPGDLYSPNRTAR